MIRDIKDITIKGGCFTEETTLEGIVANRFNIIYGRNGSGKSTIARAFGTIADPADPWADKISASVGDNILSDADRANIHVFNEDFIDRNIRIPQEESLEAIVMTGSQVALDDQIKEQEIIRDKAIEKLAQEEAKTANLQKDLEKRINAITDKLKNGGYADRGQQISGLKRRLNVSGPADVEGYRTKVTGLNTKTLLAQINEKISRIEAIKDTTPVYWNAPDIPTLANLKKANQLLGTALPTPQLNERDKVVAEVARDELLSHYLDEAQHHFHDEKMDYCPLCQRPIDSSYVDELMKRIAIVLDVDRQQYNKELDSCLELFADVTLTPLPKDIFTPESNRCEVAVNKLNKFLNTICQALENKKKSPYKAAQALDAGLFQTLCSECQSAFDDLNTKIGKRNVDINEKDKLKRETTELNEKLGCIECEPLFKNRDDAKRLLENNIKAIENYKEDIKKANKELGSLNAQMSNTSTALDIINSLLLYVFGGDNRLQLADYEGKGYRLLSHNNPVRPDSVSTGERNVIALAYFFADILRGQSEESGTRTEMLVVIDDPISSFDSSNRYGIISMLTNRVRGILDGNTNSKVLFLSHDFQTLNNLVVMRSKIRQDRVFNPASNRYESLPAYLYLRDLSLQPMKEVKSDDYYERMNSVFEYAEEDHVYYDDTIGNQIRRLMESYVTFMYRRGIDEVLSNEHIMRPVPVELKTIFNDIPAKLMLNNASHGQQYADTPVTEYEAISEQELHRLARLLLMFIYFTNRNHLFACLGEDNIKIVGQWAKEEEQRFGLAGNEGGENENYSEELDQDTKDQIAYYSQNEFTLDDGEYCYYCEGCKIPKNTYTDRFAGQKVRLKNVRLNSKEDSYIYPFFARLAM